MGIILNFRAKVSKNENRRTVLTIVTSRLLLISVPQGTGFQTEQQNFSQRVCEKRERKVTGQREYLTLSLKGSRILYCAFTVIQLA